MLQQAREQEADRQRRGQQQQQQRRRDEAGDGDAGAAQGVEDRLRAVDEALLGALKQQQDVHSNFSLVVADMMRQMPPQVAARARVEVLAYLTRELYPENDADNDDDDDQ